jgi:hypothetical protein
VSVGKAAKHGPRMRFLSRHIEEIGAHRIELRTGPRSGAERGGPWYPGFTVARRRVESHFISRFRIQQPPSPLPRVDQPTSARIVAEKTVDGLSRPGAKNQKGGESVAKDLSVQADVECDLAVVVGVGTGLADGHPRAVACRAEQTRRMGGADGLAFRRNRRNDRIARRRNRRPTGVAPRRNHRNGGRGASERQHEQETKPEDAHARNAMSRVSWWSMRSR